MKKHTMVYSLYILTIFLFNSCITSTSSRHEDSEQKVTFFATEVNASEIAVGDKTIAFIGISLIDGIGEFPIKNYIVIVRNGLVDEMGKMGTIKVPEDAEVVKGEGLTLMSGLIDAHFHYDHVKHFPSKFVRNGITSVRDPGQWVETYDFERQTGDPLPRLFLTGPHIDMPPPTWPEDSYMVRDKAEVKEAMDYLIGEGVSAIKIHPQSCIQTHPK